MNKATRMLAVTGMALMAGLTLGVGPAAAASSTSTTAATAPTATTAKHVAPRGERTYGYFRSLRTCLRVGRIGEIRGDWDDFDCDRAGFGRWVLEVDCDSDGWDGGWGGRWHSGGRWDYRGDFGDFRGHRGWGDHRRGRDGWRD